MVGEIFAACTSRVLLVPEAASRRTSFSLWLPRAVLAVLLGAALLSAGPTMPADAGTLDKIKASGTILIGYRTASPPFSTADAGGQPVGFSIDLCLRIAAAVKQETGLEHLKTVFVPVTAEDRIAKLVSGEIDIECGSTSRTLTRQLSVDFTLLTFVTGTELLVRVGSNINGISDLEGKRVALLPGTTTDTVIRRHLTQQVVNASVVAVRDHDAGLAAVCEGRADAYASDEVILIGMARGAGDAANLRLSGMIYSYEPYAFMVRKNDAEFRFVADRTLAETYRSGAIGNILERWFGTWTARPNPILLALYRIQSLPD